MKRGKFDTQSDEGVFLGYCEISRAFRVYNKKILVAEEILNMKFIEENHRNISTNKKIDLLEEEF